MRHPYRDYGIGFDEKHWGGAESFHHLLVWRQKDKSKESEFITQYGQSSLTFVFLTSVMIDSALLFTDTEVAKIEDQTAGGLRSMILKSSHLKHNEDARKVIHGWDVLFGQRSLSLRNQMAHAIPWSSRSTGEVEIGSVVSEKHTVWTIQTLKAASNHFHMAAQILNNINWRYGELNGRHYRNGDKFKRTQPSPVFPSTPGIFDLLEKHGAQDCAEESSIDLRISNPIRQHSGLHFRGVGAKR